MKKPHPMLHRIAIAFLFACSDRGSDDAGLDGTHDEARVDNAAAQRSTSPASTTPEATAREKLTCASGCVKISATQPTTCCSCNGYEGHWKRSAWSATTWLCQQ